MPASSAAQPSTVHVAVAVICHQARYLLGFRAAHQHQGNRYEFVGGKIEANETPIRALCREVHEETGIVIDNSPKRKLGRLQHDYGDKRVCLHVYEVRLDAVQYAEHQHQAQGLEGQTLTWVDKEALIAGRYPLPAANATILAWLELPSVITISYPLSAFATARDPMQAWLAHHERLAPKTAVYLRLQTDVAAATTAIDTLLHLRPDIYAIVPHTVHAATREITHLNQRTLLAWQAAPDSVDIDSERPLLLSCHDEASIDAANQLAQQRLNNGLSPVVGLLLSPVCATQTHPDASPLGWAAWSALAARADVPVIALGGLHPDMAEQAADYGAYGVAGIREFQPALII
ncbi:NUDIX domain-containing protein [Psychrobacter aestuarii]|uniref:8-oxo-dGTP diphosphatase n=1 Tax=Psychrobacter aestuarii TaxID=556327 RepID=A0ABP3FLU2_9GAMM|nr:NUDIX domain-containing protein [Psychrobacter aestuarii]